MLIDRFAPAEVASKIGVAIGVGLLVGIEREWSNKDLGARTFALTALLGALAALVSPTLALVSFIGVFLLILFAGAHALLTEHRLESTTSAALLVMFVLGVLVGQGHLFTPVASAVLMTMLLTWKYELQRFAGGLTPEEIRSAVLLGLLAFVIYPLMPNRFVDPWQLVNPREAWLTVIVIAGIGFVNYVLLRLYGARGLYFSSFLGGLVNSTAAAAELAPPLGMSGATGTAAAALLLTILAMFSRNLIIVALLARSAVAAAAAPLVAMAAVALVFVRRAQVGARSAGGPAEIRMESPVSLKQVLSFAFLFLLIQIVSTLGERYLGDAGFLATSLLGGLVSSASTTAAAANMVGRGQLPPRLAGEGVVLASLASALINLPIIQRSGKNPALFRRLAILTGIICAVGAALVIVEQHFGVFGR